MKKIMALTASVSLLALFALTTQAGAQGEPTATVDPEYVSSAGSHTVTVSGSGFAANPAITACTGYGGVLPVNPDQASTIANCPNLMSDMGSTISAPGGSFSTSITVDVPADGLVLLVFTVSPPGGATVLIKVGEPMVEEEAPAEEEDMDDMADEDMDDMDDMADEDMDDMDDMADEDMDDMDDMADEDMDDMDDEDMGDDMDDMAVEDMADDMGDDMVPEGPAATGFGGSAGSDGNSIAVPLAATLAAVVLLGGAVLITRRNA